MQTVRDGRKVCPERRREFLPAPRRPPRHEVRNLAATRDESRDHVRRFVDGLSSEERMLVVLKRELYEGTWDEMVADLRARLEGHPYIFKLAHRIVDDLERIERLRGFEQSCGVDLSDLVELDR